MTTKKAGANDLELVGEGAINPYAQGAYVHPDAASQRKLAAAYRNRTKTKTRSAILAATEMRLGLPPGAIGTTHSVSVEGHVLDAEGQVVGLTVANPGGLGNWLKLILLDYAFGATAPVAGTTPLFVGLGTGTFTGGTTDIGYLQNGITNEVVTGAGANQWNNYQRAQIANTTGTFSSATGVAGTQVASKTNAIAIGATLTSVFGAAANSFMNTTGGAAVTGTGPTPTWWFIARTLATNAAADIYAVGTISSGSAAVANGATVSFAASALTISIT